MKTRNEDTAIGRKTYFGERVLLHPDMHEDPTSITLVRNEEMRYGIQIQRSWNIFFSAHETRIIADFVQQHRVWLEWGCAHNAGDLLVPLPDGYVPQPGDRNLSAYQIYSPICPFHPQIPTDPTGIVLVSDNDSGRCGACIVGNLIFPPTFYLVADLLKIAAFVANNHSWLEWGVAYNEEQSVNAVTTNVYLHLQYQASADQDSEADLSDGTELTILLFTSDAYANYGIPASEQDLSGPFRWRPYPHHYWLPIAFTGIDV